MKRLLIGFAIGSLAITAFAQIDSRTLVPPALAVATKTVTTATSATTLILPPINQGDSVYLYEIDIQNCAGASAVTAAAVTTVSTTNLDGAPAFTVGSGVAAGLCQPAQTLLYPTGLKAQAANLPVTIVLPAFATNQTIRVNAAYRSAP